MLKPIIEQTEINIKKAGIKEKIHGAVLLADTNYFPEENIKYCEEKKIDRSIPDQYFRNRDHLSFRTASHGCRTSVAIPFLLEMKRKHFILLIAVCFIFFSCKGLENYPRPDIEENIDGYFVTVSDGKRIFLNIINPQKENKTTIYIISGYTGINHKTENDILTLLSDDENRIVTIHPRGTGYSEGKRGDVENFSRFLNDYIEIINNDIQNNQNNTKVILYGHSISTAIVCAIASRIVKISGIILINPPFKMKESEGMTPGIGDYIKYAFYLIFAPHTPIVNMGGNPEKILNPEERIEAEERGKDPLLVRYISMYMMVESKKCLDNMLLYIKDINSPLLLIYGTADSIVDKSGCDEIYASWKNNRKDYLQVLNGPHGKNTIKMAIDKILFWLENLQ